MSSIRKPTAVVVGPDMLRTTLKERITDWNVLDDSVQTVNELWQGWSHGTITLDIEAVLIISKLFDPEGNSTDFEEFVSHIAPYSFVGILNYNPELTEHMDDRIEKSAYFGGQKDEALCYYYISKTDPIGDLNSAINKFLQRDDPEVQDTIKVLKGEADERDVPRADDEMVTTEPATTEPSYTMDDDDSSSGVSLHGTVISVTSSKGGTGKSTLALSLASYLAQTSRNNAEKGAYDRPWRVALVDMDTRDGQVGFLINAVKPTVYTLYKEGLNTANLERAMVPHEQLGIDALLATRRPKRADAIPPDFYQTMIKMLKRDYDYIILDTSVNYLDPLLGEVCYPMSDHIIYVNEPVIASTNSMGRWVQETTNPLNRDGLGIPKKKIAIVINKFQTNADLPVTYIRDKAKGTQIVSVIPSAPRATANAANHQSVDLLVNPNITEDMASTMLSTTTHTLNGFRKSIKHIADHVTGETVDYV